MAWFLSGHRFSDAESVSSKMGLQPLQAPIVSYWITSRATCNFPHRNFSSKGYAAKRELFMANYPLSDLIGATVYDSTGAQAGRVRELAIVPQQDTSKIAALVLKTRAGTRLMASAQIAGINGAIRATIPAAELTEFGGSEGMLMLTRD